MSIDMTASRQRISVLGAGRWGITLAHVAARNGSLVTLWSDDGRRVAALQKRRAHRRLIPALKVLHENVAVTSDLQTVCEPDLLVVACEINALSSLLQQHGHHLAANHQLVHAIRGFDGTALQSPSMIIRQQTCVQQVGAFVGPVVAAELLADRPNAAVVASPFPSICETIQSVFASPSLRVYRSDDLVGVEVAAAGAAVGAIAVGFCLELGLGAATLATIITRGTAELGRVVDAAGGNRRSAYGLAGLGDLLVRRETESREIQAGRLLARGKTRAEIERQVGQLDALQAATALAALAERRGMVTRLTNTVASLLAGDETPQQAVERLMTLSQMRDI